MAIGISVDDPGQAPTGHTAPALLPGLAAGSQAPLREVA